MSVTVRDASEADLPAILAIYNDVLTNSAAIWRDEPVTLANRRAWLQTQRDLGFPVVVATTVEPPGSGARTASGGQLVGFASFAAFRAWPGYHPTVEHSIHVARDHRGKGSGHALLDALTERALAMGKSVMVAGIDAGNVGSIRFHEQAGFREVGRMPGIGRKFGEPLDLVLLQRELR